MRHGEREHREREDGQREHGEREHVLRPRLLVVTAVEAERAAVLRGLGLSDRTDDDAIGRGAPIVVHAGGVGMAAAAAAATHSLVTAETGGAPFAVVVSAGIAGGFASRAPLGATVIATRAVAADLGAESPDGFLSVADLGFGTAAVASDQRMVATLQRALPEAVPGDVLTVATVTGTAERAATLARQHPRAVAEAMEGFGVAIAAERAGTSFVEVRTISNLVGPRERASWRIADALAALETAIAAVAASVLVNHEV